MNFLSLKYKNKLLENEYQKQNNLEVIQRFYNFVRIQLVFSIIFLIFQILTDLPNTYKVYYVLPYLILLFVIIILKKYNWKYLLYLLIIIFFSFGIVFTEIILKQKKNLGCFSLDSIAIFIPLQLFHSFLLLTKINYFFCFFYYLFGVIYFCARIIDSSENLTFIYIIFGEFLSLLSFGYMAYTQEKTFRIYFKNIYESHQYLNNFKILMKNIIPSPIFIVNSKKKNIEFINLAGHKLFESFSIQDDKIHNYESLEKILLKAEGTNNSDNKFKIDDIFNFYEQSDPLTNKFYETNIVLDSKIPNNNNDCISLNKKYFQIKISKIEWENNHCLIFIWNDNTNFRQKIQLEQINLYKNQLLATISHNLKTPIHGIVGIIESAIDLIEDTYIKENLNYSLNCANLLNYMICDLLDFSDLNFNKIQINLEKIDIQKIINETLKLIQFQTDKKKLKLSYNFEIQNETVIFSDSFRIRQILLNLLTNAVKFTNKGFIKVLVKDSYEELKKPSFKLIVEDSGSGIKNPSQLFNLIDNPINFLENRLTGVGIGLTISQKLSKLLYEEIHVESIIDKGSKFWFYVVDKRKEDDFADFPDENIKIEIPFSFGISNKSVSTFFDSKNSNTNVTSSLLGNKYKVLIVDDDPLNIMVAEKYMEFYNREYITANNGETALNIVKNDFFELKNEIKLILMDCNMPIMSGYEAAEKIFEFRKENKAKRIPIVALSANSTVDHIKKCKKAGMEIILEKPISRQSIGAILKNLI